MSEENNNEYLIQALSQSLIDLTNQNVSLRTQLLALQAQLNNHNKQTDK